MLVVRKFMGVGHLLLSVNWIPQALLPQFFHNSEVFPPVHLPLSAVYYWMDSDTNSPESAGELCERHMFVLHVNDNTDDQVIIQSAAKKAGVSICWQVADSAERGISFLESLIKVSQEHRVQWVDLVVTDLKLGGENGLKLLNYIGRIAAFSDLPVVVLTGSADPQDAESARQHGAKAVYLKPTAYQEWVALARKLYTEFANTVSQH